MTRNNLITDIPGVLVGNAHDTDIATGVTAIVFPKSAVASVSIQGGAPGGRDTGFLEPDMIVEVVEGIVLSGGSCLLHNLDVLLRKETGLPVYLSEEPVTGTVMGAGKALEQIEILEQVTLQ